MTVQGIIVLVVIGLVLMFWVMNLVRRGRLYVGYGVIFVATIVGVLVLLAVPQLLTLLTHLVGAIFPTSALTLLALCFIVLMLVYVLTQVTLVSNRLAILVQELAIHDARNSSRQEPKRIDADDNQYRVMTDHEEDR